MKFGLFHSVQLPDPTREKQYYKEALEQVLWAEQLGYDSVWFTEHHFSRHGIVSATLAILPKPGFGKIARMEGRRYWQAL